MTNTIGCPVEQDTARYLAKQDAESAEAEKISQERAGFEDALRDGTIGVEILTDLLNEHPQYSGEYVSLHNDLIKANSLESIQAARDAIVQNMIDTLGHIFEALAIVKVKQDNEYNYNERACEDRDKWLI